MCFAFLLKVEHFVLSIAKLQKCGHPCSTVRTESLCLFKFRNASVINLMLKFILQYTVYRYYESNS